MEQNKTKKFSSLVQNSLAGSYSPEQPLKVTFNIHNSTPSLPICRQKPKPFSLKKLIRGTKKVNGKNLISNYAILKEISSYFQNANKLNFLNKLTWKCRMGRKSQFSANNLLIKNFNFNKLRSIVNNNRYERKGLGF